MPMREINYLQGIREGLQHVLEHDPTALLFGQDVGAFGGAFKLTDGLQETFGCERVFDTPICESAMLGCAIGMATQGLHPIVEMQFADFITTALHQLLNNAGTRHYRTGNAVPMVIRAPSGGGSGGGPFHSEELESFFCHMPGVKVVYPAFPSDARALIVSAVADPNPVVYMENKTIYRTVKERVSDELEPVPIGKARVCHEGQDAVVIAYGAMVHEALRAAGELQASDGYEVMVLDLRSLKPYDLDTILAAVAATGRALVVSEGWKTCGFAAEISAAITESAFHLLDAPVRRLTAPDTPIPFSATLENRYRPSAPAIATALRQLIEF
ncbi:MAG: alpha-ketoacid dehydrogenase subunit beta [Verrucomicrobia bacterium]|jgi:pyruvate/2-oxoglutarate/acetoin dehydrogenase E1 component|nr:alpha-ketoacid dehydrogenase subunit beta [Verrucomicrobiota bacterium]MBT7068582.1 alpha-ketoacid dehydrogenase subunit beta [Verrucomicrobiota bacterium]MBT7699550.1 alpha-ketoacid dehydrogenase subunit beta [Verrucomicrobiota bacterium]